MCYTVNWGTEQLGDFGQELFYLHFFFGCCFFFANIFVGYERGMCEYLNYCTSLVYCKQHNNVSEVV